MFKSTSRDAVRARHENLGLLAAYKAEHGTCAVPDSFVSPYGAKLGSWVNNQRASWRGGNEGDP